MKYTENGYKEINGVYVKTYLPVEDGTPATEKQKVAIKNMEAYLRCGDKSDHNGLSKRELNRIDKLTKLEATKEIKTLIQDVKDYDNAVFDAWASMPNL